MRQVGGKRRQIALFVEAGLDKSGTHNPSPRRKIHPFIEIQFRSGEFNRARSVVSKAGCNGRGKVPLQRQVGISIRCSRMIEKQNGSRITGFSRAETYISGFGQPKTHVNPSSCSVTAREGVSYPMSDNDSYRR